jgi:pimeloyl-ACP methyl ester carboxylesterase
MPSTGHAPITAIREGSGPEVLLVHGGASPETTWSALAHMSRRWTLVFAYRRGYPPSPPFVGRQDFDVDAADLAPLLDGRPHVVAHSYGALGAVIAATRRPGRVRSLTLVEPALFLDPEDPEVARLKKMGDAVLTHGLETDPPILREFLQLAGAPVGDGPLSAEVVRGVLRAHGSRSPGEADPAFDVLRDAGVPTLVVSGGHTPAMERMCDAVSRALDATRLVVPSASHFVASAPAFSDRFEQFLVRAG